MDFEGMPMSDRMHLDRGSCIGTSMVVGPVFNLENVVSIDMLHVSQ